MGRFCLGYGLARIQVLKELGYPTKYDAVPTDFINPNTVELPEVEADQPYDDGQIYINSESEED